MDSNLQDLFLKLKLEMENQTKEITTKLTEKIDEKLQPIIEENRNLKIDINNLEKKVAWLEKDRKKNNIIIFGMEESEKSNQQLIANVISEINKLEVELSFHEINCAYRAGKKIPINNKARPIIVMLVNTWKRNEILKNKKKSKDIYISEDYPKEVLEKRRSLQTQLQEERKKGKYAYIKYDTLIVKNNTSLEKRKRAPSTPTRAKDTSQNANMSDPNNISQATKISRMNAFDLMRSRSNSLGHTTDKNM